MKRKTLFKRLSSAAMALLLSLSALTQGITASAFSSTNKATQEWLNEWSYDFRGSGLPNGYDIETGKSNDTHFLTVCKDRSRSFAFTATREKLSTATLRIQRYVPQA